MKRLVTVPLMFLALLGNRSDQPRATEPELSEALAEQMEKKLAQITDRDDRAQGAATNPHNSHVVTVLLEEEINSYFKYRMGAKIPAGISQVRVQLRPQRPSATALVDFDRFKAASRRPIHPLLDTLLDGQHTVGVRGRFTSSNGSGVFHLEEVSIGSLALRGALLELLVRHFIQPRYPEAAINRPFALAEGIEQAVVEEGRVVIHQK